MTYPKRNDKVWWYDSVRAYSGVVLRRQSSNRFYVKADGPEPFKTWLYDFSLYSSKEELIADLKRERNLAQERVDTLQGNIVLLNRVLASVE